MWRYCHKTLLLYKAIAIYVYRNCPSPIGIYVSSRGFIRTRRLETSLPQENSTATRVEFSFGKARIGSRVLAIASIVDAFTAPIYFRLIERQHVSSARRQPRERELPVMELSSKRAQRDRLSRKRDTSGKNVLGMAGRGNIDEPPTCASFHLTDEIWMAQCTLFNVRLVRFNCYAIVYCTSVNTFLYT